MDSMCIFVNLLPAELITAKLSLIEAPRFDFNLGDAQTITVFSLLQTSGSS